MPIWIKTKNIVGEPTITETNFLCIAQWEPLTALALHMSRWWRIYMTIFRWEILWLRLTLMSTAEIPSPAGAENSLLLHSVLCSHGNSPNNPPTPLMKADGPGAKKNTKSLATTKEKTLETNILQILILILS